MFLEIGRTNEPPTSRFWAQRSSSMDLTLSMVVREERQQNGLSQGRNRKGCSRRRGRWEHVGGLELQEDGDEYLMGVVASSNVRRQKRGEFQDQIDRATSAFFGEWQRYPRS